MKKNIIRTIIVALVASFVLSASAFATATNEVVDVTIMRNLTITFNGEKQDFFDASGKQVFAIAKDGTTYLPTRATAGLFNTPIAWLGEINTVAIGTGATETNPVSKDKIYDTNINNEVVKATVMRDLTVTFNGVAQTFTDVNGKQVYPMAFNGTTYLPVRATAGLFSTPIEWKGSENRIAIGTDPVKPEEPTTGIPETFCGFRVDTGNIEGAGDFTSFLSSVSGTDKFPNGAMVVKASGLDIFETGESSIKFYNSMEMFYINFTVYNAGTTDIIFWVLSDSSDYAQDFVIKSGEVRDMHVKVAGSEWVSFEADNRNYGSDTNVAIGNLVAP